MQNWVGLIIVLAVLIGLFLMKVRKGRRYFVKFTNDVEMHVNRTFSDSWGDGRESMQFHILSKTEPDGKTQEYNGNLAKCGTHWMMWMIEDKGEK